jgi:2',3'-cyclic-nucleotide 2'-phosphodiesterase (5'-nucleotidase family)
VLIVAVGGGMRYLGHLVFDLDDKGHLTGIQPQSRPVPVDENTLLELSATVDRELLAFEQRVQKELLPLLEVIGHTSVYLEGAREKVRNRETNLGDVSADAILATARAWSPNPKPTFALRNAGALRASIGSVDVRTSDKGGGDITKLAIKSALRFDSNIVTLTLTHAALRDTIEASLIGAGSARGHFPQVSAGVEIEYATKPRALVPKTDGGKVTGVLCPGRRVQRLVVPGPAGPVVVVEDGETKSPRATVTLATIDYLSSVGD